jgi:hypothetical protein
MLCRVQMLGRRCVPANGSAASYRCLTACVDARLTLGSNIEALCVTVGVSRAWTPLAADVCILRPTVPQSLN